MNRRSFLLRTAAAVTVPPAAAHTAEDAARRYWQAKSAPDLRAKIEELNQRFADTPPSRFVMGLK
jgi:hypothetical protein